ncbi:MAG: hypothetical protein F4Y03_04655 [Alphaproteobacteria bacterium]|nr:hypothetical protein [Alphaproteobacteria bacterium]
MTKAKGKGKPKDDPAAELEVMFPDQAVPVTDPETGERVTVTVREFRFRESMELRPLSRPLVDAMAAGLEDGLDGPAHDALMAEHADTWLALLSRACGRPEAWLAELRESDGAALDDAMWTANKDFFLRRVVAEAAAKERPGRPASPSETSSTPLSGQDTGEATKT